MKRLTALFLALAVITAFSSCATTAKDESAGLSVVATLFPQYDFAKAIVGEKGSVTLLLPPGAESHSFEIKPSDVNSINKSDIFIYTGPDMEVWVNDLLPSVDNSVEILNMADCVDVIDDGHDDHAHGDPHIWTSPVNARKMLASIYEAICRADSQNAEYYKLNFERYDEQLERLDVEFKAISSAAVQKTLYFSGAFAFEYFVEEYGFSYSAPFNSCSDVQIESAASVIEFINEMKNNGVKYVFYQELAKNPALDTIVSETGATPLLLHSAHNVSKEDFDNGVTYVSLMQANAENLRKALCNG